MVHGEVREGQEQEAMEPEAMTRAALSLCGVKVKLSLCSISSALCHEDVWGSGGTAPPFLTSAVDGGERSASCPGCRYTLDRRLGGLQSPSERCGEK
jgi:hypothetical protein